MAMPNDLVLVRHGESEGNLALDAAKRGNDHLYTDEFMTVPGHRWRLTPQGCNQAKAIGEWIGRMDAFDRYYCSPYVRTKETAGHLGLQGAQWRLNRALRERDWGDIGSLPMSKFKKKSRYEDNVRVWKLDPLYWVVPGGESIAQVAEDRVRNVIDTLHRECAGKRVICVCHGEVMWAFRLVLERIDDDDFVKLDADEAEKIHNCSAFHYSRIDPKTGEQKDRLSWVRRAYPVFEEGKWEVKESEWMPVDFRLYSNEALLESLATRS